MSDIDVRLLPNVTTPLLLTVVLIPVIVLHVPPDTSALIIASRTPEQPAVSVVVISGVGYTVTLTVSAHPLAVYTTESISDIVVLFVPSVTTPLPSTELPIPVNVLHVPPDTSALMAVRLSSEQPAV